MSFNREFDLHIWRSEDKHGCTGFAHEQHANPGVICSGRVDRSLPSRISPSHFGTSILDIRSHRRDCNCAEAVSVAHAGEYVAYGPKGANAGRLDRYLTAPVCHRAPPKLPHSAQESALCRIITTRKLCMTLASPKSSHVSNSTTADLGIRHRSILFSLGDSR